MTLPTELVPLLQALVRIPSPNPPGDTRDVAAFIADWMRAITLGAEVTTPAPEDKPEAVSVIATIGKGHPIVLVHAHIDTVPIAQQEARRWSVDPYAAEIRANRVYGKGSVDDKAPLAAMMIAFVEAAQKGISGTLVLVAAAEEEVGGQLGTKWLADNGNLPAADFFIIGEQTHNHAAIAHKGVIRAEIRATGRAAHATNPDRGINAITAMAKVVLALEQYHASLRDRVHPLIGTATCNVGVIHGGSTFNAVPDTCTILVDRRMIPHDDPAEVQDELRAIVARVAAEVAPAELTIGEFLVSGWFSSTLDSALGQTFLDCIRAELDESPGPIGYLPGSDAKHVQDLAAQSGGEIVVFGPGSYEVAHAFDEYVDIDELQETINILRRFLNETLALKGDEG
ncbi:MAG: M20 family metallopeptidase [Burkholderiales bacterium]|nr:M20 family metallopeptidase [Anaerolineae bacterium]